MMQQSHSYLNTQLTQKYVHTKTYTQMFITAALFITAQNWKQPRCPSTGECINCRMSIQWIIQK